MTPHEVRTYMSQGWKIRKEIKTRMSVMEELRSMAEKATTAFTLTPSAPQGNSSRVESYAIRIVEMQQDANELMDQLLEVVTEIQKMISCVPDPVHRAILMDYHLRGIPLSTLEDKYHYSRTQLYVIRQNAYKLIASAYTIEH